MIGCKGVRGRRADSRGFKDSLESVRAKLRILFFIRTVDFEICKCANGEDDEVEVVVMIMMMHVVVEGGDDF